MDERMKYPLYETEFLSDPRKGIVTITTYWSDGSTTVRKVPKYPPVLPVRIDV